MAEAAHLRISVLPGAVPAYHFELDSPLEARPLAQQAVQPVEHSADLLAAVAELERSLVQRQRLGRQGVSMPAASANLDLDRLGRRLYQEVLPAEIGAALRQLPETAPLVLSTADTTLPWELLHDGRGFLLLQRPIARRLLVSGGPPPDASAPDAGKPQALLIASDPRGDLAGCRAEIEGVEEMLAAEWGVRLLSGARASLPVVRATLAKEAVALIHYCGHAQAAGATQSAGLLLAGEEIMSPAMVNLQPGAPLVFLNACRSAQESLDDDDAPHSALAPVYHGLASAFAIAGARAVIGSRWPVSDVGARHWAERFYHYALSGLSLGATLLEARRDLARDLPADPAWASYLFYGDPGDTLLPAARPGAEPDADKGWLPLPQAAQRLGIPYREAHRLATSGAWPTRQQDGQIQVGRQAVEATVARGSHGALPPAEQRPACSRCGRLLSRDEPHICQHPGCGALLCARCWAVADDRFCSQHAPGPDIRLAQAREDLAAGRIPLLVAAEAARQQGHGFVQRLQQRFGLETGLTHPISGKPAAVDRRQPLATPAWSAAAAGLAPWPPDAVVGWRLEGEPPLLVSAACLARAERMQRQGFDSQPLDVAALRALLDTAQTGITGDDLQVIGWASVTGWDPAAVGLVQGTEAGSGFFHNQMLVFLVDLPAGQVFRSRYDGRGAGWKHLFLPLTPEEEERRIQSWVREQLLTRASLSLAEVTVGCGVPPETARRALEAMMAGGDYRLEKLKEHGLVVWPNED
jgi:hypothetical protein